MKIDWSNSSWKKKLLLKYPALLGHKTPYVIKYFVLFRFLLKLSEMTGCYVVPDETLENSSIDLAIANHSLAKRITEKAIHNGLECNGKQQQQRKQQQQQQKQEQQQLSEAYMATNEKTGDSLEKKGTCLSAGEQRAVKVFI